MIVTQENHKTKFDEFVFFFNIFKCKMFEIKIRNFGKSLYNKKYVALSVASCFLVLNEFNFDDIEIIFHVTHL